MENLWQMKCGSSSTPSLLPSSSLEPRDQTNTGYYSYPHIASDLRSTVYGRMEDPVFSNSLSFGIHRPGHADQGNSFLALLSGSPSLLQCDFQELSHPRASGSCGKLPSNGTSVTTNAFGGDIPPISSGLLSDNLSNQNMRIGTDFCSVVSSRAVMSSNCSGNSIFHGPQGSDLAKAVGSHMVPVSEKVKVPSLSGEWHGTSNLNMGNLSSMNFQSLQKMPSDANASISKQSSTFMNGCPRVFCLDTTGYLLLSNTGLLGIVCSCHCFHMSVSKFCEHSGLCDVNPGDVVHMDSGETISEWCKLYFQKFRIRVPEDQSGWDWPEGLSVTAGFVKSSVSNPNLCKSSDLSHWVGSSGGLVRSGQPVDHVLFPKNTHTDQNLHIDTLQNEKQRNFQDVNNFLLKNSVGTSWRNLHAAVDNQTMEGPISRCSTMQKFVGTGLDNGCQSISGYIDGIVKNRNPSISCSPLQNVNDLNKHSDASKTKNAKNSVIVDRGAASSNIELRLGQPYQPSWTSGNSILPVTGPQLSDKLGNPPKSCFPLQMIHNAANYREEDYRQYHHCPADPFHSGIERQTSRMNPGSHAFGVSHSIDTDRLEKSKCNVARSSVVLPLTEFNNPADSAYTRAKVNMANSSEHMMPRVLHCASHAAEHDKFNVCWNGGSCLERQLSISDFDTLRLMDKGKAVGCLTDVSLIATDTGFGNHKQVTDSVLGGSSVSAVSNKGYHLHQLCSVPLDASDARNLSSYVEKDPCPGSTGQSDDVFRSNLPLHGVSMGFPSVPLTPTPDTTPALFKQEGIGVSPYLLDEDLRFLALRQILELSKQQHALSSLINQERGRCDSSSDAQHSIVDPSTCQEQRHGPYFTSKQGVSEAAMNLLQSAPSFRTSDGLKKVASATGLYDCRNISTFTPGIPFHPEEASLPCDCSDDPIQNEQSSSRFGRGDNNVSRSSKHDLCSQRVPYTYYQGKCSCEARTNYLGRNVDPKVGNSLKERMGAGSSESPMIVTSRFAKDPFLPKDTSISVDESEKLNGKLDTNIVCNASQWRDVPTKVKGVCDSTVVDRLDDLFDGREDDGKELGEASSKYFNGAMQTANSLKDQENSNVSSGCSAPDVTQASIEVNNMDFSTIEVEDTGDVSNQIVDEGSGIDKCWSSDDALGSARSAEFLGSSSKTKLRKERSSHIVKKQSRSLLDELKLIDSLTWKKGRNQIHGGHQIHSGNTFRGKSNKSQRTESGLKKARRKKAIKLKMLSSSFPSAGPSLPPCKDKKCVGTCGLPACSPKDDQRMWHTSVASLTQSNSKSRLCQLSSLKTSSGKRGSREEDFEAELNCDTNFCENPDVSGRKKLRKDFAYGAIRQFRMQEPYEEADKTKYDSVGVIKKSSCQQVNEYYWKAKPVVCGKYGEITCGKDVHKPAKIVPLSRVLKNASRNSLSKSCKPRLTSTSELKKTNSTSTDLSCVELISLQDEEGNGRHNVAVGDSDKIICDSSMEEAHKALCNGDKQHAKMLSTVETERDDKKEKGRCILGRNTPAQLKLKCKEIRKRSIYELTIKGKKSMSNSIPFKKFPESFSEMKVQKTLNAEDSKHDWCRAHPNISIQERRCLSISDSDAFCCVCGSSNQDDINCLLECGRCSIRVHQACYGISKVPKGRWYCRPCRTSSKDIVCVLCGYGGGAMTRALRSRTIVKGILKAWNVEADCRHKKMSCAETLQKECAMQSSGSGLEGNSCSLGQCVNMKSSAIEVRKIDMEKESDIQKDSLCCVSNLKAHNSITAGVLDSTVKQWVHMVCGLWTSGTRCPNVDTMTAFDVSGASRPKANVVCSMCNRPGGSCIECRVVGCHIQFHPWCAHQKGLLQSEVEGVDNENVGFYGRCILHATYAASEGDCDVINLEMSCPRDKELTCARTEGYSGRKQDDHQCDIYGKSNRKGGCLVPQEQLNAWIHINGQKSSTPGLPKLAISDTDYDCRKEYARYKQAKGWKHLVVYKSGIHALGLYTSRFISRGEMVVEYVGEIVGLRVADKRENEYQSGRKLQYKSACYFFRIDKEHIIDATRKGGIARFVNHSCLPNCVAKVISVRNEKKVVFFAQRDIFPGEEITYDYHFNHEDEGKKIPCFCNSKNCRRYLN